VKLFQIEEPDGSPSETSGPGLAIGIAVEGRAARVAVAVGGNAELLPGYDGAERVEAEGIAALLLAARGHAEKALSRPVTHAVVVAPAEARPRILAAAPESGLTVTRVVAPEAARSAAPDPAGPDAALLGAAILAEDDAARA
jgi:hypothetical protein